jgi:hypothetical protein
MLACRAISCHRPPCFIQTAVNRRFSVLPAFGILPPQTTVSRPATITMSPYIRRYSTCRSKEVMTRKPESTIPKTCCFVTSLFNGLVTTKSSDHRLAISARSFFKNALTSSALSRRTSSSAVSAPVFVDAALRPADGRSVKTMKSARVFMPNSVEHAAQSPASIPILPLQNRKSRLYSKLRSEFCNYAVGPWVSVAGRETALARGNPAMKWISI